MSKWRVIFCGVLLSIGLVSMAQASLSDSLTVEDLKENGVLFTPHNRVTLLPSGAEKFEDMFKAIEQARHYIYLEYFNFRSDSIGKALFTLLDKKVREGVKVRVIYDDFGNVSNDRPLRKRHLRQLKSRHFEVVVFDPIVFPWVNHALHRDHRKIVVIDDKVVYTGGMNVADYYIHGRPEFGKWRDMHMRLEGDCVPLYRRIFCEMWERCTGDKIDSLVPMRNACTLTVRVSPSSSISIGAAASKLRSAGTAVGCGCGVAACCAAAGGGSLPVTAGLASGSAAKGAARVSRVSTAARRNVFFKGRALLAICGAGRYNRGIPARLVPCICGGRALYETRQFHEK